MGIQKNPRGTSHWNNYSASNQLIYERLNLKCLENRSSRLSSVYAIIKKDMSDAITKKDLKEALESLTINLCKRMDQRFDAVDQRFDAVDRKFELMDKRFDRVEVRLDGIDMRIDNVECQIEDIALMTKVQFDELDRKVSVLSLRTSCYRH